MSQSNTTMSYWNGPVWNWFSLSYCAYAVFPRALLCGMPTAWQEKFVALMEEMAETYDYKSPNYMISIKGPRGKFLKPEGFCNYRYPPPLPYRHKTMGRPLIIIAPFAKIAEQYAIKHSIKDYRHASDPFHLCGIEEFFYVFIEDCFSRDSYIDWVAHLKIWEHGARARKFKPA